MTRLRVAATLAAATFGLAAAAGAEGLETEAVEEPPVAPRHEDLTPAGPTVEQRIAEIHARVQRAARYPAIARVRGVTGEALLEFEIDGDGTPRDVRVARSSGSAPLDRAATRAVHDAAPLPRVIGSVQMPVRFQLTDRTDRD